MRPDIVPGAVFPDNNLSDHRGVRRTLSELQEADPLVRTGEFTGHDLREGLLSTASFAFAFWMGRVTYARELKRARE